MLPMSLLGEQIPFGSPARLQAYQTSLAQLVSTLAPFDLSETLNLAEFADVESSFSAKDVRAVEEAVAARHVRRMKKAWLNGDTRVVNRLLTPRYVAVIPTREEEAIIWARAEEEHAATERRCRDATAKGWECHLTMQNVYDMIVACWAGNGRFYDVTGAAFNLYFFSIKSMDHYTVKNSRVMHKGLNMVKNDADDDRWPFKWLVELAAATPPSGVLELRD